MTATKTRTAKTTAPAEEPAPPADPAALVEAIRAKQAAALDGYEQLVKQAAAGSPTDADEAVRTLFAAGKTADDLAEDIAAFRRRVELRRVADQVPAVEAELRAVTAAAEELDRRRAALLAQLDQEQAAVTDRRNAAVERLREVKDAERQLQHTCTGPRKDRLTRAARQAEQAGERLVTAKRAVGEAQRAVEQVKAEPAKFQPDELGRQTARLQRAEAAVAEAEREAAAASAERTEALIACLQP